MPHTGNINFNNHSDKGLDLLQHANDNKMLETVRERIKLKLGHIGAAGAILNEDKMLNVSLVDLYKNGIIDEKIDIEISSRPGCGHSFEGAAVAAEMYYKQEIRAFIELDAVAKMATFWNTPVISYTATNGLIDKTIYGTLARVSFTNVNSITEAVATLLVHYKWFKVAIVTNVGDVDRVLTLEEVLKKRKITVLKKVTFEINSTSEAMIESGLLNQLRNSAR
ncbi:unnamed protein product, partial [Onchocerca ochengi]|uniref:ANF_receptor domain-containing protein n=1 Tax=Onchocerca ochengi TaxID=42157 RepID=A0A182EN38_ONCOC